MRSARVVLSLLLALALPTSARASDPPPASQATVQIALRTLGWTRPLGRMSQSGLDVTRAIEGAFPLILDLGGKVTRHIFVGAYLGFNLGKVGSAYDTLCQGSVSCNANNVRIGLQIQAHLRPASRLNPWFGMGAGSEATTITAESRVGNYTQTLGGTSSFQGPEYLHLSSGLDYRTNDVWGFGPFVAFTVGRYQTTTARNVAGINRTTAISEPASHQWLMIGVRGVLFP